MPPFPLQRLPFFYGWVVVGLSFFTLAVGGSANSSFSLFYVALLEDFGWSRAEGALAFSISMLVFCGGGPLVGWLTDRLGPRKLMPAGVALLSAGLLASSQMSALWHLYLLYGVVIALGITSIGFVPNITIVSNWFARHRATAMGIANAGQGVGALFFLPLIQGVIESVGWRGAYVFLAAMVFVALLPPLLALQRGRPADLGLKALGEEEATARSSSVATPHFSRRDLTLRDALSTYRFWTLSAVGVLSGLSFSAMMVHPVAHMVDLGYPPFFAAAIFGLAAVSRSGGGVLGGLLSDRLGRESTYTAFACASLLGVAFLWELRPSVPWLPYAYALAYGLGSGATGTISSSLHSDIFRGRNFGAIFGLTQVGAGLGAAFGPWLAGLAYDRLGSYGPAFQTILVLIALSVAGMWIAAPRKVYPIARTLP